MTIMTHQDKNEFLQYLAHCTDQQVLGVMEKEKTAGRREYAELALQEAKDRNLL